MSKNTSTNVGTRANEVSASESDMVRMAGVTEVVMGDWGLGVRD
jgi:hypothetical protein